MSYSFALKNLSQNWVDCYIIYSFIDSSASYTWHVIYKHSILVTIQFQNFIKFWKWSYDCNSTLAFILMCYTGFKFPQLEQMLLLFHAIPYDVQIRITHRCMFHNFQFRHTFVHFVFHQNRIHSYFILATRLSYQYST